MFAVLVVVSLENRKAIMFARAPINADKVHSRRELGAYALVQLGSLKAPTQPYENRFSNEELVEFDVGRQRAPALNPKKNKMLECMINGVELEDEICNLTHERWMFYHHVRLANHLWCPITF